MYNNYFTKQYSNLESQFSLNRLKTRLREIYTCAFMICINLDINSGHSRRKWKWSNIILGFLKEKYILFIWTETMTSIKWNADLDRWILQQKGNIPTILLLVTEHYFNSLTKVTFFCWDENIRKERKGYKGSPWIQESLTC